ncbi:helix-turn-helix domain-containing protein [Streptomyces sp. NPDC059398]|uniref:helix-turn-helix domain-containing protein n=1 Tax=Streptomyces sp. NPDC059398 TaxID=3346820 RepID=UPI003684210A
MPAGGRPTVRSRRLGAALRRYREMAKLDQEHAAEQIAGSKTKISRIKTGQVSARPGDVRLMLELYGVEDREVYRQLEQLARDSNKRGWWLDYQTPSLTQLGDFISLEADSTYIRSWQPVFVPGVLQSPDYTRALIDANPSVFSAEAVEEIVQVRQERRKAIAETGSRFAAVIWEPALTSPMASPTTHREQLALILAISEQQNVTVQVLPHSEWAAARITNAFVTFAFDQRAAAEAVAFDSLSNTMILEGEDELSSYSNAFDSLRSAAMTPEQSRSFIKKTMSVIPEENEQA